MSAICDSVTMVFMQSVCVWGGGGGGGEDTTFLQGRVVVLPQCDI